MRQNNKLEPKELEVLKLFGRKSQELLKGMSHMPRHFSFKFKKNEPASAEGKLDNIIEKGLLVAARQFIEKGETLHFDRVANIVTKAYIGDSEKLHRIKQAKRAFKNLLISNAPFNLEFNGRVLSNLDIFKLYSYANHIHIDMGSRKRPDLYTDFKNLEYFGIPIAEIKLYGMIEGLANLAHVFSVEFIAPLFSDTASDSVNPS